jgi:hypothetical protein
LKKYEDRSAVRQFLSNKEVGSALTDATNKIKAAIEEFLASTSFLVKIFPHDNISGSDGRFIIDSIANH